jgi:hypothetical protein
MPLSAAALVFLLALQPLLGAEGAPAEAAESENQSPIGSAAIAPAPRPAAIAADPFRQGSALRQSGLFLAFQHLYRFSAEPGTRANLRGPFFRDWSRSLGGVRGWKDGDNAFTNYVGHPMMGAVSGWIYLQNDPRGGEIPFSKDPEYWRSRLRAARWSALYSAVFEYGPASETSLGNVGLPPHSINGAVDMVVTPTLGTGLLIAEDMLDRFVVLSVERLTRNRPAIMITRGLLTPNRAFANMLRFKWPWHRDTRRLRHFPP